MKIEPQTFKFGKIYFVCFLLYLYQICLCRFGEIYEAGQEFIAYMLYNERGITALQEEFEHSEFKGRRGYTIAFAQYGRIS